MTRNHLPNRGGRGLGGRRTRASVMAAIAGGSMLASAFPASGVANAASVSAVTAAVTAAPAPAVGKLTQSGCTGTGAVTCDLYAMTGTATLLGKSIPIWGFSSTGAAGSAKAPGPVLVVNEGDTVSITLHNQLSESVSLALPGQPGLGSDDVSGVGNGSSKTYTFTASRPGTFVYEAGHTADGARQVAMGLAGALVVLSSDGTAEHTAASAYDDEAVLALAEIDPALNAAPATFDMRNFKPRYRLINGESFPETNEVPTDQGHKVLLRYVNVGSQTHSMTVLGGVQTELALGGHALAFPGYVATEVIEPGQTVDAVITMPTGPEAKLAVYEPAQHLDNDSQHTADPLQTAFGGMMTFLDTAAPPPSTDGVGPVSTHISASPNPSDGLADVTVTADVSDATTGGSTVSQAEFVIDDAVATAVGYGTPMTGAFGTVSVAGVTGTISTAVLNALDAGKHIIYVRGLDSAGNWGVIGSVVFNLPKTGPQTTNGSAIDIPANGASDVSISATGDDSAAGGNITAAEYFLDTVGANGAGTALSLNRTATIVSEDVTLLAATVKGLGEGQHHVFVHSKDSLGLWGPPLDIVLPVDLTGPGVDAASVGPNPSNGVLSDKGNPGNLVVSAQITDRDAGNALQNNVVAAEAFFNKTPPAVGGTGLQLIAVDGKFDSTTETAYGLIPLSQVKPLADGTKLVYVRGKDAAGNWGPAFTVNLIVDKTAPVLGTLTATPNPVAAGAMLTLTAPVTEAVGVAHAEVWTGTTDPGVGLATAVPVSLAGGNVTVSPTVATNVSGNVRFNLRVQDTAGNWSTAVFTTVTVTRPNGIFADSFEGTSLNNWAGVRVGGPNLLLTTAAKVPLTPAIESPATTKGLQVSTTAANRLAYVTDSTPAAETTYHARFAFNASTLRSGTAAALTIFEGRTGNNNQAFQLQYRWTTATGPQVRVLLGRNFGGALTGAWVTMPNVALLQVDWTSATAGSLRLSVNGAAQPVLTGNNTALTLESVRLGITAGATNATNSTGPALFDSFLSTRNTMP